MIYKAKKINKESGNVLFLILIAVALFAALSYVVTQSTRSGGGSTEREKNILSSAQMTQYPTALRTAMIRLVLGGVSVENVKFDAPGTAGFTAQSTAVLIFHPSGGGATYQQAPADLMTSNSLGAWNFNGNFDVPSIGVSGSGGNDVIAFLRDISSGVCKQLNEELSISTSACGAGDMTNGVPEMANSTATIAQDMVQGYTFPTTDMPDIAAAGTCGAIFTGQASGCFYDVTNSQNVFYSVLLER